MSLRFCLPVLGLGLLLFAAPAQAQVIRPEACFPPPCSALNSANPQGYAGGNVLGSLSLTQFCTWAPVPPNPGDEVFLTTPTLARGTLSLNGGSSFQPFEVSTSMTLRLRRLPPPGSAIMIIETEMLQLDLTGGTLPGGVRIRESPTMPSTGQAMFQDIGGGLFQIQSFFDIFTELSVDGGQTFAPAVNPMHLNLVEGECYVPEPGSSLLFAAAALGLVPGLLLRRRPSR